MRYAGLEPSAALLHSSPNRAVTRVMPHYFVCNQRQEYTAHSRRIGAVERANEFLAMDPTLKVDF